MKRFTKLTSLFLAILMVAAIFPLQTMAAASISSSVKSVVFNATYYANRYADLKAAFGTNESQLYNHFVNHGVKEGRQASPIFSTDYYLTKNGDLKAAFGSNRESAMNHFMSNGINEIRVTAPVVDLGTNINVVISTVSGSKNVTASGNNVVTANPDNANQTWLLTRQSDGSYKITNNATGKVLDVYAASRASGANVDIYASNDTNAQRWYIFQNQNSSYTLRAKCGTTCVLTAASSSAGANVYMSTFASAALQQFKITTVDVSDDNTENEEPTTPPVVEPEVPEVPAEPEAPKPANLGTRFNASISLSYVSKNIAVSGTNVIIYSPSQNSDQVWRFERQSDGSYVIVNNNTTNYVLTVQGGAANGTNVYIAPGNGSAAQRWFIYEKDGKYTFCSALSENFVLDVAAAGTANMTNVQIWTSNSTNAQLFNITKGVMSAMTFNVYCGQFNTTRTNRVLSLMKSYTPDTIGIQEATPSWMTLLKNNLGGTYGFVGLGREGGSKGEHSAIMYNKHIFKLLDSGTKWLSGTPDVVSKFPDSSYIRIFTYALLQRIDDGKKILVVNTHVEYTNDAIRIKQLGVLYNFLKSYGDYPTILTGDFNTTPGSATYNNVIANGFVDSAKNAASRYEASTFTNFGADNRVLDYVFASASDFNLRSYRVCNEKVNGDFPSDHHPIFMRYIVK